MSASPRSGAGQHLPRLVFWEVTKGCNLRCMHCRATATELAPPPICPPLKPWKSSIRSPRLPTQSWCSPAANRSTGRTFSSLSATPRKGFARGPGHQRHPGHEGSGAEDCGCGRKARLHLAWTAPMRRRTTASAEFPAPSTRPSAASGICRSLACRCRST